MTTETQTPTPQQLDATSSETILRFCLAGNATLTFQNTETDNHFTYKVKAPQPPENADEHWVPPVHFVSVLTGQDNTSDYTYVGFIRNMGYIHGGRKSRIGKDAQSNRVFQYVWNRLVDRVPLPPQIAIWHEGRCGRCGRVLTEPESVDTGFGPICRQALGI